MLLLTCYIWPKGTSKSAVTAGLIGGRVGNKGGVGISLDIAGTTFLFLNAHLAGLSLLCFLDHHPYCIAESTSKRMRERSIIGWQILLK